MLRFPLGVIALLAVLLPNALLAQTSPLGFEPIDAQYSSSLDKVIMISANPNELHIYDPVADQDTTVPLSSVNAPLNVSVSPDGYHAAVMQNSAVAYINLQTGTVEQSWATTVTAGQVVLSSTYIYIFPDTYTPNNVIAITLQTSAANAEYVFITGGRLDAPLNRLYSYSYVGLTGYDVSSGPLQDPRSSPSTGYQTCGDRWFSPDGSRLYTGCGTVFHASTDPNVDMTYLTSIPGLTAVQSLSASGTKVAVIPSAATNAYPDTEVRLYESTYLNQIGRFVLPNTAHGKWVFFNKDGTAIYAITEATPMPDETDFSVDTIALASPVTCSAGFTADTTVNVAATGSLETAAIASNTNCAFQATSDADWIHLISGSYGSGDTTLAYVVRPNPNTTSRSGTITLNSGATLTISQNALSATTSGLVNLSVNPVAADYSKALDRLVYVSASPNELHLYDPSSGSDTFIALVSAPLSVSVDPTGMYAAVGHQGWISYLSLQPLTVLKVFPITADVSSLSLAGNGYVYAFPQVGTSSNMFSLQLSDGTITPTPNTLNGQNPRLTPSRTALYTVGYQAAKWDISTGTASYVPEFGPYLYSCENLWLSQAGDRIYTGCGDIYEASSDPSLDFTSEGAFAMAASLTWAADSEQNKSVAVIPLDAVPNNYSSLMDTQLKIYSNTDFTFQGESPLPSFQVSGIDYAGHGKYVFWNAAESRLVVLEQADSTAPLLSKFAVYVTPPPSGANSSCSFSVDPTSITLSGSIPATLSVTASAGCGWSVQSPNWINISKPFGTGSSTFTLTAYSNDAARAASIIVAGQTVTISEPASPLGYTNTTNVDFGDQVTGTMSLDTITFTSSGSNPVVFSSIELSENGGGSDFVVLANNCGPTLPGGQSCAVTVGFRPAAAGYRSAELIFNDNAYPFGPKQTIFFYGWGTLSGASAGLASLSFGSQQTGIRSSLQTVTFRDTGPYVSFFKSISVSGDSSDFLMVGSTCGTALAAGQSCTVSIAFRPTSVGKRTGYLTFSNYVSGSAQAVLLTGTGIQYLPVSGSSVGPISRTGDFNGDGRSDFVVWRPSNGAWYVLFSNQAAQYPIPSMVQQWGLPGDIPVTGDFNGDKRTDFAVWRPSNGSWYVLFSDQAAQYPIPSMLQQWGLPGDIPVPGDYNGDGKTDFAVWRPSLAVWYVLFSSDASQNPTPSITKQWGLPGDIPIPGDYDGDGKTDFAVWRPSNGTWYIIPSSDPQHPIIQQWGLPTDIPVAADFTRDGKADLAVWRPSQGNWYVRSLSEAAPYPATTILQQWGLAGDLPQVGDFFGQGRASFAIWRPSNASWFILNPNNTSSYPAPSLSAQWGFPDDIPQ